MLKTQGYPISAGTTDFLQLDDDGEGRRILGWKAVGELVGGTSIIEALVVAKSRRLSISILKRRLIYILFPYLNSTPITRDAARLHTTASICKAAG
jgi:hypothetical protein